MNVNKAVLLGKHGLSCVRNTALLGGAVAEFWLHYFGHRRFPKKQEFYVVYTSLDHSIPFQPHSTLDYLLINLKLAPTATRLGGALSGKAFNDVRDAYIGIVREGCAAFKEVPTIMPGFNRYDEHALRPIRILLKPINCSPSLHTAVPLFIYNLGAKYCPEKEAELRRHVGDVVSTIIGAKLHAMIDVALGIFLCKRAITDKLGLDFNDLESFFIRDQKSKDKIGYEHVYRMYREIDELARANAGADARLPCIMERYFQKIGLPRVKRGQSNCLYDLERQALVSAPELRVGKGLL